MHIKKLIALILVFTACVPAKVAFNPVCDVNLLEPFTKNITNEVQVRLARFEEKPIRTKLGVISYIYPCAVWDATLTTNELSRFAEVQTGLVEHFMKKHGAISTDYDIRNAIPNERSTSLIIMKTARAGIIVVETNMNYAQNGETIETRITINASKI